MSSANVIDRSRSIERLRVENLDAERKEPLVWYAFTDWLPPDTIVSLTNGRMVPYRDWCITEARRFNGRVDQGLHVPDPKHRCAERVTLCCCAKRLIPASMAERLEDPAILRSDNGASDGPYAPEPFKPTRRTVQEPLDDAGECD